MKKLIKTILASLVAVSLSAGIPACLPSESFAAGAGGQSAKLSDNRDKSEIIVKYKSSGKEQKVKSKLKSSMKLSKLVTKKRFKNARIDLLEIGSTDGIEKAIEELRKDPNVEYAQPNYKLEISSVPQDEYFGMQWGLENSGQEVEGLTGRQGVHINAINAWNITKGSSDVLIGVLDTGIDINHKDLKQNIYVNKEEIPGNGIDDDGNGYIDDINGWDFANADNTVYDDSASDSHGTHVAGIIAAASDSEGITGAAPGVKLLPLKFINGNWGYTCDAIDAIEYAMSKGVKIINCSFGGTDDNFALKDTMENSGILFICAAGNRGADTYVSPVYPACFDIPNVLSVASIDSKGVLSPYSGYGSKIHVAAPGVNILSTTPGDTYDYLTGTSAAVPYVTGAAALLQSYMPELSYEDISNRIKSNVAACTKLEGKLSTEGRVDAFAALTGEKPEKDTYTGEGNDDSTVPSGQQGGNEDTWYTQDQLSKIKEQLHYGESGVNPASGNFSFTVNDMSVTAPGFQINISRTYNSLSGSSTHFSRGWAFGFEGKVEGSDVVNVTLPDGSVDKFRLTNGSYIPEQSRNSFIKKADGTYLLTTPDQYKYYFNSSGVLAKMEDRNGNAVSIQADYKGKIQKITDTVGRDFNIAYNSKGLIDSITDVEGRKVKYAYDSQDRLESVTDPKGGIMRYGYDTWGFLTQIRDHSNNTVETLYYNYNEGENQYKVLRATDALGSTVSYAYDMTNKKTTATDLKGRVYTYWFDSSFYTTQVQDPEGKSAYTEYFQYAGKNKYGDIKSTTDRNGNKTLYEIDDRGNIIKITNPDGTTETKTYDAKNNLLSETDASGKITFYIYDDDNTNLIKEVRPLNGTDTYKGTDSSNFAVTAYKYYTDTSSGCTAKGLLKSVTDAENNTTTYTYDSYGNIKATQDPMGRVTADSYNCIGWKTRTTTPEGHSTDYIYDSNGQLIKEVLEGGEAARTVYDLLGRKIQEISPAQYEPSKDSIASDTYSDSTVGTRYEYYAGGKLKKATDAMGNATSYTYDIYGNMLTESRPDGSVYRYEYDILDRTAAVYFKEASGSSEVLAAQYSYAVLSSGRTQETQSSRLNAQDNAVTADIYDYAGRPVEHQNADGTKTKTDYNPNGTIASTTAANGSITYYRYDGLDRLTEAWTPFEIQDGKILYTYAKTEYDRAGSKLCEKAGLNTTELFIPASSLAEKSYAYYADGKVKAIADNEGRKTEYAYDGDGNLIKEDIYTGATDKLTTEYAYNYLGKVSEKRQHISKGDIAGNNPESTDDLILKTIYAYDKNGNTKTITAPDGIATSFTYDLLNRQTGISQPGTDETGRQAVITTSTAYNWEGKPLTSTDANGRATSYKYNGRGLLVRITDAKGGITLYDYDLGGRKISEVSPANYSSTKTIEQMSRIEYTYDVTDRLTSKKDIYIDPKTGLWDTVNTKTCRYDTSGNLVKEMDAGGYEAGTGQTIEERLDTGYGTEYAYNLAGKVTALTDAVAGERGLSFTTKTEYDGLGREIVQTDARGVQTHTSYDGAGNILEVSVKKNASSPAQTIKASTYDLAGRVKTQTDANGSTITFEYNASGKIRKTVTPGDGTIQPLTTKYQYSLTGNLARQWDSMEKEFLYAYDNQGRQLSSTERKTDGTESITIYTAYDKGGNKRFATDGNGITTESTYDELNRLVSTAATVNGTAKTTVYSYDANGNQTGVTDWKGNTSTNSYDPMNRLIEKKDPYTSIQKLEYNSVSLQAKSWDALGNLTQYTYDKNNRLIQTTDPEGHTTKQSYDDAGNIRSKTDGRGLTATYTYDQYNRLISVTDAKSQTTSYTYDLNGNMLTQTDGNGNTTAFEYNTANKQVKRMDHDGRLGMAGRYTYIAAKTESITYNADGTAAAKTDRNGSTAQYSYDIHGRLLSMSIGGDTVAYTYDNNGNQLTMTDSTGETIRTYDEENRVLTKIVPEIGKTSFQYDILEEEGCHAEITADPMGNETKRVYDKAGRLIKVIADGQTTVYTYLGNGSQKSVSCPDGSAEEYSYSRDGLNTGLVSTKADGSILESYSYTYDAAHNQTSKADRKGTTVYAYDSLNRLEKVTEPDGRITAYTYDKAGNRLTESGAGVITTYAYNEQNRLMSATEQSGGETRTSKYSYDNNGNAVSVSTETVMPADSDTQGSFILSKAGRSASSDTVFYRYDVWNQMTESVTGDKTVTMKYNGDGLRVEKAVNGTETRYLYESDRVILETDGAAVQTARNVYGTNLISRTADGETFYYIYNGHADVTALLRADGTVAATYYYDAFGNITEQTGEANNSITYAGYQYDSETGLYYLNARMYDPVTARFMQEDTYRGETNDPLSLNLYTYCHNEPIMYVDPTGHVAAKLRDLVTSAKGTIKWNSKDSSITATVNGVTRTFGYNSFKLVNGSAVIDSKAFDSAFSSKTRTVSTQVGKSTISVSTTVKTSPGQSYTHTGSGTNTYNGNIKQQVKTGIDNKLSGIVNNKSSNNVSTQGKGNSSSTGKGLGSSIVDAYKAHQTSGNIVYDEINFWTLGIPESAKTIWTSEPFSKENIIASLEIAMVVIPEAKGAGTSAKGAIKGLTGSVDDVIKGTIKTSPEYGRKLDYVFGKATGSTHNIERSLDMERQLNRIGIQDNAKGRAYVQESLTNAFNDTANVLKVQDNGRIVKESLLTGPNGVVKVQSVWQENKLITVEIFGGGK